MSEKRPCKAIAKKTGLPCTVSAMDGSDFCWFHNPEVATERKEKQAFGGRRGRRRQGEPEGPPAQQRVGSLERLQDPLVLADEVVVIRRPDGTLGHPQLTERQRQVLRMLSDPDTKTAAIIWPKRSGKTMLASLALLAAAFKPGTVSICLSNSEVQARALAFSRVQDMIKRNRVLSGHAKMTQAEIRFDWGSSIECVPCNRRTVTGLTVSGLLHCDELWASPDEQVYFLLASQAEQGKVLLTSQPSGHESHVYSLWKSYDEGLADKSLWVSYLSYASVAAAAEDYPNPFIDLGFLQARESALPHSIFSSYFLGEWGTPGTLFRGDIVEGVFDPALSEAIGQAPGQAYVCGLDLGLTHSRAARVILHWEDDGVVLDSIRIWEGSAFPSGEVEISAVEQDLFESHRTFNLRRIVYDPYELRSTRQRLDTKLPMEEFSFTATSVGRLSKQVFALVNEGRLQCYPHAEFREELLGLVAVPGAFGWRLDHKASGFTDITVSVGMGAMVARQYAASEQHQARAHKAPPAFTRGPFGEDRSTGGEVLPKFVMRGYGPYRHEVSVLTTRSHENYLKRRRRGSDILKGM